MGSKFSKRSNSIRPSVQTQTDDEPVRPPVFEIGIGPPISQLTNPSVDDFAGDESHGGSRMNWYQMMAGSAMSGSIPPTATFYRDSSNRRFLRTESIGHLSRENSNLHKDILAGLSKNVSDLGSEKHTGDEQRESEQGTAKKDDVEETVEVTRNQVTPLAYDPFPNGHRRKPSTIRETPSTPLYIESTISLPSLAGGSTIPTPAITKHEVAEEDFTSEEQLEDALSVTVDSSTFDEAIGYLESVQNANRKKGQYREFPTMELLQIAQKSLLRLKIVHPKDKAGWPLPFPHTLAAEPYPDLSDVDEIVSLVKLKLKKTTSMSISTIVKSIMDNKFNLVTSLLCVYNLVHELDITHLQSMLYNYDGIEDDKLRAIVFTKMCSAMKIRSVVISGQHKRGIHDYRNNKLAHWSAVLINGNWSLVDASPSGFSDLELWKAKGPIERDNYFLVDPVCFIHTHLPTKSYWQQVCRLINRKEWSDMVYLTPNYFRYGFQLLSNSRYILKCELEPVTILLKYTEQNKLLFHAELLTAQGPAQTLVYQSATSLKTRSVSEKVSELIIKVIAPNAGNFTLAIFGLDITTNPYRRVHLCSYRLYSSVMESDVHKLTLFPSSPLGRYQWGPGADTLLAGYKIASHANGFITSSESYVVIKLAVISPKKRDVVFRLFGGSTMEIDFNPHVFQWSFRGILHFIIYSPGPGAYSFHVCHRQNGSLDCFISYLLTFQSSATDITCPPGLLEHRLGNTNFGTTAKFVASKWIPGCAKIPESGEIELSYDISESSFTNGSVELKLLGQVNEEMKGYTTCSVFDELIKCSAVFPRAGSYILSFYGINANGTKACLNNSLLLVDTPSAKWTPFPITNIEFLGSFRMNTPTSGLLAAKAEVYFSLDVKDALDVAIVTSSGWNHLVKEEKEGTTWTGIVNTGARNTEMKICARFEVGSDTFTPLCVLKTISEDEFNARTARQIAVRNLATHIQNGDLNFHFHNGRNSPETDENEDENIEQYCNL